MVELKVGSFSGVILAVWALALIALPVAHAQSTTTTTLDPQDQIVNSLCQVVNLVKYIAGAVAVLAFAILGIQFMTVGSNPIARDDLKTKMGYVVVGMFIILISNYIVALFLPQAATCPLL